MYQQEQSLILELKELHKIIIINNFYDKILPIYSLTIQLRNEQLNTTQFYEKVAQAQEINNYLVHLLQGSYIIYDLNPQRPLNLIQESNIYINQPNNTGKTAILDLSKVTIIGNINFLKESDNLLIRCTTHEADGRLLGTVAKIFNWDIDQNNRAMLLHKEGLLDFTKCTTEQLATMQQLSFNNIDPLKEGCIVKDIVPGDVTFLNIQNYSNYIPSDHNLASFSHRSKRDKNSHAKISNINNLDRDTIDFKSSKTISEHYQNQQPAVSSGASKVSSWIHPGLVWITKGKSLIPNYKSYLTHFFSGLFSSEDSDIANKAENIVKFPSKNSDHILAPYNNSKTVIQTNRDATLQGCRLTKITSTDTEIVIGIGCNAGKSKVLIAPQSSSETCIPPIIYNDDVFNSCHSVEWQGTPSIMCKGTKTSMIYIPYYEPRIFDYVNEHLTLIQYIVHYATKCYKWLKSNKVQKQDAEQELLFLSTAETTASLKIQQQEIEEAKKELRALSTQKPNV
ncbi:hypothetical protein [Candidatus Tisiphia endosymbiont of Nemotelus uliginosus]|uniref:hypothetical protein n=1 Tax=Candidatus Tisiphia endosymbiont of Nemotelus uliginosus TaxID=3077926 RepID=UPI0035C93F0A